MRSSLTRCGLVALMLTLFVSCQSTSGWHMPTWSLSKMNPFSYSHDEVAYPAKPSSLATPGSGDASPGYAAATSPATGQAGYKSTAPAYAPTADTRSGTGYSYPSTSANTRAGSTAAANPAVAPQTGYYGSPTAYGPSGQRSAAPSSYGDASTNSYRSYDNLNSAPAGSGYTTAGTSGRYASDAGTASRYGTASDRYGLDPSSGSTSQGATSDPYRGLPGYTPQPDTSQSPATGYGDSSNSGYSVKSGSPSESGYTDYTNLSTADARSSASAGSTSGHTPGSSTGYASEGYRWGGSTQASSQASDSSYGSGTPDAPNSNSLVGDRYAQTESAETGSTGYNGYRSGEYSNSLGNTGYVPANTNWEPGNTGYIPGDTGYNPPSVGSYRSSAGYSTGTPYLPGSTKPLSAPQTNKADNLDAPDPSFSSQRDSRVVPASHVRY